MLDVTKSFDQSTYDNYPPVNSTLSSICPNSFVVLCYLAAFFFVVKLRALWVVRGFGALLFLKMPPKTEKGGLGFSRAKEDLL